MSLARWAYISGRQGRDLYRHATQVVFGEVETGAEAKQPKVAILSDIGIVASNRSLPLRIPQQVMTGLLQQKF